MLFVGPIIFIIHTQYFPFLVSQNILRSNAASFSSKHFPHEISLCFNLAFVHICKILKFSNRFSTSFLANRVMPWSSRYAYSSSSLGVPQQRFVTDFPFVLPQSMPDPTVFFFFIWMFMVLIFHVPKFSSVFWSIFSHLWKCLHLPAFFSGESSCNQCVINTMASIVWCLGRD